MDEDRFWRGFASNAKTWFEMIRADELRAVFDQIDSLMTKCNVSFCFDVTADDEHGLFVLSPEGDIEAAHAIDQFISFAPPLDHWKILGRRQRKHLDDAIVIVRHIHDLDIACAKCIVSSESEFAELVVYLSAETDLTIEESQGLINTFLWHALGEHRVMSEQITGRVELGPAPSNGISISEAVQALTSRSRNAKGSG